MKIALITGILGQDGSYLAELLLSKGYEVHGLIRRNSNYGYTPNIAHIKDKIKLHYGDMTDSSNLLHLINQIKPDEVYNLAAQSHVHVSFELPEFTSDVNGIGVLRLLEAIRSTNSKIKFYQASTSEMFGKVRSFPQNELTPFYPRSPYGVAKLYGYWITVNYRESYDMFTCNGILFNHESPRRGANFVTKKIAKGFYDVHTNRQNRVELGNLDAKRDWGHASDYVEGMWLMLQHDRPDDYVLSTGTQHTVREFCEKVASYYDINLVWYGEGLKEVGLDAKTGKVYFGINPEFYRPAEVETLLGDSTKARTVLGWTPKHNIDSLVNDMCKANQ